MSSICYNNAFYLMLTGNFALNGKHKSYLKNRMIFGSKFLNYCIHLFLYHNYPKLPVKLVLSSPLAVE